MLRGKVEKFSISVPSALADHMRSAIRDDSLQGVSEYIQRLIREDQKKSQRKIQSTLKQMGPSSLGIEDLQAGRVKELTPESINIVAERTLDRIMENSKWRGSQKHSKQS